MYGNYVNNIENSENYWILVNENDLTTKDYAHYNLITKQHYQELIKIKGWKSKDYSF